MDLAIDGRVYINNILDEAVQELDLLFNTDYTQLIGYPTYGCNFQQFLWTTKPDPDGIRQYISNKIQEETYYLSQLDYTINVDAIIDPENYQSSYIVQIIVQTDDKKQAIRTYKL